MRVFILILTLVFIGCSRPTVSHKQEEPEIRTVIMGDPMKMIEGATLNPKIDFSFFEGVETVSHFYTYSFLETNSYNTKRKISATDGQESAVEDNRSAPHPYEVSWSQNTDGSPQVSLTQHSRVYTLYTEPSTGKSYFHFKEETTGAVAIVEILHFSVSADKQHCSILFSDFLPSKGQAIVAFYYSKKMKNEILEKLNPFNYLRGAGAAVAWSKEKPIELSVCGQNAESIKQHIVVGVKEWNVALDSLQTIDLQQPAAYYPFSDLNQHCIYYVDSYLFEPRKEFGMLGVTMPVDFGASKFTDGDIFVFKSEFLKNPKWMESNESEKLYSRTIVHEIGHFLGLHHQFDGTKSIMSYDFKDDGKISEYDKNAVRELYK